MMGLGYPWWANYRASVAKDGDENRFDFPIPLRNSKQIAFSLSGLKNAVRVQIKELIDRQPDGLTKQDIADISASFQKAVKGYILTPRKTEKRIF